MDEFWCLSSTDKLVWLRPGPWPGLGDTPWEVGNYTIDFPRFSIEWFKDTDALHDLADEYNLQFCSVIGDNRSPYQKHVMVSRYLVQHPVLKGIEKRLLLYFLSKIEMDEDSPVRRAEPTKVRFSVAEIRKALNIGKNKALDALNCLQTFGLISREVDPQDKRRQVAILLPGPWPMLGDYPKPEASWIILYKNYRELSKAWRKAVLSGEITDPCDAFELRLRKGQVHKRIWFDIWANYFQNMRNPRRGFSTYRFIYERLSWAPSQMSHQSEEEEDVEVFLRRLRDDDSEVSFQARKLDRLTRGI
jgi:DNA-binding MarR family transcriptional regulator